MGLKELGAPGFRHACTANCFLPLAPLAPLALGLLCAIGYMQSVRVASVG